MKTIAIIDYQMGNVASVKKAFISGGADALITFQRSEIETADAIVLPGVGAFGDGMKYLKKRNLVNILTHCVLKKKTPFLGICLGMQLLATKGYEFGIHDGLGWIEGETIKLEAEKKRLPHIGWDDIVMHQGEGLFAGIKDPNFYFDHSFVMRPSNPSLIIADCEYGEHFAAAVRKGNIFATQFHPEKSQESGLCVIKNFLSIC